MPVYPRRQPTSDISPAGHRGEVVELIEQAKARERAEDAQTIRCAPDPASGETERRAFVVEAVNQPDNLPKPGRLGLIGGEIRSERPVDEPVLFCENLGQRE